MAAIHHSNRRIARWAMLSLVVFGILLSAASLVQAKMLVFVERPGEDWGAIDDPLAVEEPYITGFFGRLDADDDLDAVAVTFTEPVEAMQTNLHVPRCESLDGFYPSMALIGPGLDRPDDEALAALPFELPEGMGAIIEQPEPPDVDDAGDAVPRRADAFQIFTLHFYAPLSFVADIPQAGEYLFVVWDDTGATGAYMLMTGTTHPDAAPFETGDYDERLTLLSSGNWLDGLCAPSTG